jgi:CubicO group peptidase (beta-lactamase class C family)/D-alanyl-D-alanine dipeptidase
MRRHALLRGLLFVIAVVFAAPWSAESAAQTRADTAWTAEQRATIGATLSQAMQELATREDIPSVAVGVFDRNGMIWSGAHGYADAARTEAAGALTPYYAGSISKLFTDIVAMQLVEEGRLDLDTPVRTYLPDFAPANPFQTEITLRFLMTHRSGLVREPPVGSYYDIGDQNLADVVRSLNNTTLVAEPGTLTKYSNAAIAVVGRVIEAVEGKPYAQVMRERLLDRLGMSASAFSSDARPRPAPAYAMIPGYDTERVPAPRLGRIGLDAAGGLVTTVDDLARFGRAILNQGAGEHGRMLSSASFAEMTRRQFDGGARTFGLGFDIRTDGGVVSIGHGGAIYGYVADLRVLPDQGIGVVAFAALDLSAAPMTLSELALRATIAARTGQAQPGVPAPSQVLSETERLALQGSYFDAGESVYVRSRAGEVYIEAPIYTGRLRRQGGAIAFESGLVAPRDFAIDPAGQWVRVDERIFRRAEAPRPPPPSSEYADLIGEYGPDNSVFRVFERDGRPYFLAEVLISPVIVESRDRWRFTDRDWLYAKEAIEFIRDGAGAATAISLNGVILQRRPLRAAVGAPDAAERRELQRMLRAARQAAPPSEAVRTASDLARIADVAPDVRLDLRYATRNNFLGVAVYGADAQALAQRPAAEALARANAALMRQGYAIVVHDAYRPWYVTKLFWDATAPDDREFVADPAQGSRHNRGAAVDISLIDLSTGEIVQMPGAFDETSDRSYANYTGGSSEQRWLRELLRTAMEREGFDVYPLEWWHYDFRGWRDYPIGNLEPRLRRSRR